MEDNTYVISCGATILGTGTMNQNTISRVYVTGYHWTTDGGYVQLEWRGRYYLNELGAKCVEMEGAGLFTIANFRSRKATAIYVISDSGSNDEWDLGWVKALLKIVFRN